MVLVSFNASLSLLCLLPGRTNPHPTTTQSHHPLTPWTLPRRPPLTAQLESVIQTLTAAARDMAAYDAALASVLDELRAHSTNGGNGGHGQCQAQLSQFQR
jgi:hypothetical protein